MKGYICCVFPYKDCVDFGLEKGTKLSDPHKLLQGIGTRVKYLRFQKRIDINPKIIKSYIKEVLKL